MIESICESLPFPPDNQAPHLGLQGSASASSPPRQPTPYARQQENNTRQPYSTQLSTLEYSGHYRSSYCYQYHTRPATTSSYAASSAVLADHYPHSRSITQPPDAPYYGPTTTTNAGYQASSGRPAEFSWNNAGGQSSPSNSNTCPYTLTSAAAGGDYLGVKEGASTAEPVSALDITRGPPGCNITPERPKLTTTIWEDEGTICYQVDAKGICVARRADNDMINGTKLLNVVGMSRGKRDGILKNEKGRVVIKVGAMHLKGVWIPLHRAICLATKFRICEFLYPLFETDPKRFVYSTMITGAPPRLRSLHSTATNTEPSPPSLLPPSSGRPSSRSILGGSPDSLRTGIRNNIKPTSSKSTSLQIPALCTLDSDTRSLPYAAVDYGYNRKTPLPAIASSDARAREVRNAYTSQPQLHYSGSNEDYSYYNNNSFYHHQQQNEGRSPSSTKPPVCKHGFEDDDRKILPTPKRTKRKSV